MSNRALIEEAFERRTQLTMEELSILVPSIEAGLAALERGELRAACAQDGQWVCDTFVKKLILLSFLTRENTVGETNPGRPKSYDKLPLKFEQWDDAAFRDARIRVVPGAVVRAGAYIAPGAVLMPCFINIGAYVGEGTMIDTWSTVGSCAQVGARCHISGGVGLGGVLEPIGDNPVVIEDNVFIGARSEVAEGVIVRSGAVIGMGVYLGASTPIIDRATGEVRFGEVPANAVVIAGNRADPKLPGVSLACAVIVKYVDERTRSKTALNDLVRALSR
ncbi:2,3,4,5-tetrahydropyridine-2,6-dicarboxylate N-succinyltransferase [Pseudomonas syringae]|uniref:2,3,4,5-tetrahydropyridine-2,6-dicarboxylate N-succinyltransferase n=1 Tax=Pseudomonas syringae TaxID=317 RepID=UPI0008973AFE|nr:2,3,4,5-tetrahydropyridine-2,6-dicarboxylate N-succinyltransferase [Pseudomonas syringae]SDW81459.1 2,3,4,5-tetrahydropyridine-2,6-dicarboxylate N-succinyltransferase [Pseudomonas syringae]SFL99799.1 2,3,4,5-tetrahydropyridine-2,6-dicarboxylate N-succinyltransferase [Pseudomonas syringae]